MSSNPRSSSSSNRHAPRSRSSRRGPRRATRSREAVYDLYVAYPCETRDDVRRIVGDHREAYRELEWPHTRVSLLAAGITSDVLNFARHGDPRYGGGYKSLVHTRRGDNPYTREVIQKGLQQLADMGIYPPQVDLATLPGYTTLIQFRFTLLRPYMSHDDEMFYIHEAPLQKDSVFKVPVIRPTSWKGLLRSVVEGIISPEEGEVVLRLFGTANEEMEEGNRRGRLYFYPTFLDRIDLKVINPHSRITKSGTAPILMEVAPPSAQGIFTLLYLPFDLVNQSVDIVQSQVSQDLRIVGEAIVNLMRVYGFSAKRARGFGLARRNVGGLGNGDSGLVIVKGRGIGTFRRFSQLSDAIDKALSRSGREEK